MENLKNIVPALIKAKSEFGQIEKKNVVRTKSGQEMYRYATLDQIIEKTQPALSKNGLCIFQMISGDNGQLTVTTILAHESGAHIENSVSFPGNPNPQQAGSLITYYKRYSYSALLGINSDEDTDGNQVSGQKQPVRGQQNNAPKLPSDAQKKMLNDLFKKVGFNLTDKAINIIKGMDSRKMSETIKYISENEEVPEFLT